MRSPLIELFTSDDLIDRAYQRVCVRRQHYRFNNDVWQLRRWWDEKKRLIVAQLRSGTYRFREQRRVSGRGDVKEIWSALDALVLKAMAIVLSAHLKPHLSLRCFHLAGSGGMKAAVREVVANVADNPFVFRTDIKGALLNQGMKKTS